MKHARKAISMKATGDTGQFRAVFSTFNVVDKDGDVTLPTAFTDGQKVRILPHHNWGAFSLGKGVIHVSETEAWVDGEFNMDDPEAVRAHSSIKFMDDLQEWSYGFQIRKSSPGVFQGTDVRYLEDVDVFEVSPVTIGAGENTRTEFIKSAFTFEEQGEDAIATLTDFVERAQARAKARTGHLALSAADRDRVGGYIEKLAALRSDLEALLAPPELKGDLSSGELYRQFLALEAQLNGVQINA